LNQIESNAVFHSLTFVRNCLCSTE